MNLEILRHSTAHVLAIAVKELFPKVKLGIGPAIEEGFYYDFEREEPFTPSDLKKITKKMREIINRDEKFEKITKTKAEAKELLKSESYKLELLEEIDKPIFYKTGEFIDLCAGPHINSTKDIKAFKLLKVSGAYWKGDSKNKQLQRIYGVSFPSKEELEDYLTLIEEAKKRDHIKLGKELGLYIVHPAIGKGLPLFTPKGATIKRILQRWIEDEEIKRGYLYTDTPILAKTELYKISGHLDHYKDKMFIFKTDENEEVALRPMTCPYQFMIYKSKTRSYKELPIKYAETSILFRKELSGELHGLIRIWQFTLADAHIICKPDQIESEFEKVLEFINYIMKTLGFKDYWYRFSKWDPKNKEKYIDNPKAWEKSEATMKKILDKHKFKYKEIKDDAAFYGPKLDIQMKNVWGKEDTIFTVQIDFALPERFDMTYEGEDGKKHRPMVIHRSSIGCYERTIAMLIEHYAGHFPLWLAPIQVTLMTITDQQEDYAKKLVQELKDNNIRAVLDIRAASMSKKVRDAQLKRIPLMVTIGEKEQKTDELAVRDKDGKITKVKKDKFIKDILEKVEKRC